ncbi:MAG: insulinase family protein [Crocinitomicaceae bacterium]|nr:insulinase family protein [Crocinitomicaceae bacterium]
MDRSIAPQIQNPDKLEITKPKVIQLNNGIELYWIDDVKDSGVKLEIVWDAGTKYQSKSLIASYTNKLLLSGTSNKTANQITNEIDFLGGYYQNSIDKDHAGITLYGLTENMTSIFLKFMEAFQDVVFPESELDKETSIGLQRFKVESEKVNVLCHRNFNQRIFGEDSAYGTVADESDFAEIKKSDLEDFFKKNYKEGRPVIFLVGEYNNALEELLRTFSNYFDGNDPVQIDVSLNQSKGTHHFAKDGAIQSAVRVGRLLFDKNHEDYFGFQVLNTVLGGYFGSRLMANIREDKGYTYGIGSGVAVMQEASYFFIATEVGKEVRENTLSEINMELERLRDEVIPEDELLKVKNYLLGDFLRQSDGPFAMMECFKNIYFNQLEMSYYSDFIDTVNKVTAEELKSIASKYLNDSDLLTITVG